MAISLKKNPRFLMLDTETIFLSKRVYELAFVVFDSVTCVPLYKARFYIRDTVRSAIFSTLKNGVTPIFWPNRLNALNVLKHQDCVEWQFAVYELLRVLSAYGVSAIISHNVNFDVRAIYNTSKIYSDDNSPFLAHVEKLELSGYFVHGLPAMVAYNAPFKIKSGCVTFKADYLVPLLTNGIQEHDALGDCMNQIELYKLTKGKYQNQGTIYGNMLKHHALKHDDNKRLGESSLD